MAAGFQSWQFDRISDLLKRIRSHASELASVSGGFPLATDDRRPEIDFRKAADDVVGMQLALAEARNELGDSPLDTPIITSLRLATTSVLRMRALARSITLEDRASSRENRAWTWSGAAAAFNAHVRSAMTEPAQCDWDVLVEGVYLHELDDEIHALIQLALGFVMAPPLPDHVGQVIRRGSAHEEHVRG